MRFCKHAHKTLVCDQSYKKEHARMYMLRSCMCVRTHTHTHIIRKYIVIVPNCDNYTAKMYHASVVTTSTLLLLTAWLNSWESISQPVNYAYPLILPFCVFPLYAHARLVRGHFLMLHRLSWTLSLTESDHQTPSHALNHLLKPIFSGSPTGCVCVWPSGLLQSVN